MKTQKTTFLFMKTKLKTECFKKASAMKNSQERMHSSLDLFLFVIQLLCSTQ